MRKIFLSVAAAAAALSFAAPAAAQWAPPVYRYQPYNYGYGYNGIAFARSMADRVQRIRGDIRNMEARRILSYREARSLDNDARSIQRRIFNASRNGIQPGEARNIENRIRRLEIRITREANDWNRRPGHRRY
jgi:hypothetical protein